MKISYFRLDIESVYSSRSGDSNKGIFKQIHQEMVELNWLQRYVQNLVVFVPKIENTCKSMNTSSVQSRCTPTAAWHIRFAATQAALPQEAIGLSMTPWDH